MYRIYCDNYLLHDDSLDSLRVQEPKLDLELNKTGTLTFTIYPNHPYFDNLHKMKSIIRLYQKDDLVFRGRILNDEQGFYNQKQVICEGELAFLIDSIMRPYEASESVTDYFARLITTHNSQVDASRQFVIGQVTVTDGDTTNTDNIITRSNKDYTTVLDELNDKLINNLGGYITFDFDSDNNRRINYITEDDFPLSNQKVNFGENLINLKKTSKGEELATVIIPLGANENDERLTISALDDGVVDAANGIYKEEDYIRSEPAIALYGRITKVMTWDDVTTEDYLLSVAIKQLIESQNLIKSIELDAVDLAGLNTNINAFKMATIVKVNSHKHGLVDENFTVSKISIDLLKPASNKLTLGSVYSTFTESSSSETKSVIGTLNKVEKVTTDVSGLEQKIAANENSIVELNQEVSSMVNQTAEEITTQVSNRHYLKGEIDTLISSIETKFTQNDSEFELRFNEFLQSLEDAQNGADAQFQEISKYIRFTDGNIILGEEGNELTLKIESSQISFLQNDVTVAYFSNRKLYVLDGEFINTLKIGNFSFIPRSNGNVSFKKVT